MTLPVTSRNLIITGYIEPNKPRIARQVAERLKMTLVDVQQQIETRFGDDIATIRAQYGERRLKTAEDELMQEIALYRNTVIRVNGSTLANSDYTQRLQATSVMVCLVARLDAILQRLHLSLGARYHDPAVRAAELGVLQREWAVRQLPHVHELDATYSTEPEIIADVIAFWQQVAIERA